MTSMKKFIALFLTLIYFSTNASFAFSELYYLKNIKTTAVEPIVSDKFTNYGFNVISLEDEENLTTNNLASIKSNFKNGDEEIQIDNFNQLKLKDKDKDSNVNDSSSAKNQ